MKITLTEHEYALLQPLYEHVAVTQKQLEQAQIRGASAAETLNAVVTARIRNGDLDPEKFVRAMIGGDSGSRFLEVTEKPKEIPDVS